MTPQSRPQLLLPIASRATFLEHSFDKGDAGGLFVPGEVNVALGEVVDLELHFVEDQVRFHIRGLVKWKRENAGRRALPPGIGIEFLPSEQATREHLRRFALGEHSVHHVQRDRRYSLHVDVKLRHNDQMLTGITDDISEGGCFFITNVPLVVGEMLQMRLRAPGSLFGWITLTAAVAWRRTDPARRGIGLQFEFQNDRERRRMAKIVALHKARMVRELQIRTPRVIAPPTR